VWVKKKRVGFRGREGRTRGLITVGMLSLPANGTLLTTKGKANSEERVAKTSAISSIHVEKRGHPDCRKSV